MLLFVQPNCTQEWHAIIQRDGIGSFILAFVWSRKAKSRPWRSYFLQAMSFCSKQVKIAMPKKNAQNHQVFKRAIAPNFWL